MPSSGETVAKNHTLRFTIVSFMFILIISAVLIMTLLTEPIPYINFIYIGILIFGVLSVYTELSNYIRGIPLDASQSAKLAVYMSTLLICMELCGLVSFTQHKNWMGIFTSLIVVIGILILSRDKYAYILWR